MTEYNQNSQFVTVFHVFPIMEKGATLAGYSALIAGHATKRVEFLFECVEGTVNNDGVVKSH